MLYIVFNLSVVASTYELQIDCKKSIIIDDILLMR